MHAKCKRARFPIGLRKGRRKWLSGHKVADVRRELHFRSDNRNINGRRQQIALQFYRLQSATQRCAAVCTRNRQPSKPPMWQISS